MRKPGKTYTARQFQKLSGLSRQVLHLLRTGKGGYKTSLVEGVHFKRSGKKIIYFESAVSAVKDTPKSKKRLKSGSYWKKNLEKSYRKFLISF